MFMVRLNHSGGIYSKGIFTKGLTLVETLVVLAVIAILLTIASPMLRSISARATIKSATESVSQAFRIAKNTARVTNKAVTVTFTTEPSANSVSFSFPGDTPVVTNGISVKGIGLPARVTTTAKPAVFTFDPMGNIVGFSRSSTITLTSTEDRSRTATINIINKLGYLTVVEGATMNEGT